jgi:hypothetical protein
MVFRFTFFDQIERQVFHRYFHQYPSGVHRTVVYTYKKRHILLLLLNNVRNYLDSSLLG